MRRPLAILAVTLVAVLVPPVARAQEAGEQPRYMSIKWREARVRVGPGFQYPIRWVYRRLWMPVLAQRRVENWVLIRDWEGEEGWIHSTALSGSRTVIVTGALRELRDAASQDAALIARLQGGVIGQLERCDGDWCRADFQGYRGWIRRNEIWGVSEQD